MEFYYYSPSETFVMLTADQFVGRDDGLLEQQKQDSHVCRRTPKEIQVLVATEAKEKGTCNPHVNLVFLLEIRGHFLYKIAVCCTPQLQV